MSSLMMSTSATSTTTSLPSTTSLMFPLCSKSAMASWSSASICAAIPFISLPNFFPIVRKLHFTRFTSTPCPSTKLSSFTFTSLMMRSFTASICAFWAASTAGTIICCNGWRTLIFTLRRSANTIDVIFCAISIRASNSLSMQLSSATGNEARCTESKCSRPVALVKSV